MGKICTFCKYNESKDKCGLIESMASVKHTERCTCYEPVKNVAPVIHAHWELYEDGWYCTNCELYAPFDCDPEEKGIPYCPNCGAKMDEEVLE